MVSPVTDKTSCAGAHSKTGQLVWFIVCVVLAASWIISGLSGTTARPITRSGSTVAAASSDTQSQESSAFSLNTTTPCDDVDTLPDTPPMFDVPVATKQRSLSAYTHAVYGVRCNQLLRLVALAHRILHLNNTSADFVVFLGPGCPAASIALSLLCANETGATVLPLEPLHVNVSQFQTKAVVPSKEFRQKWLRKLAVFQAMEKTFVRGTRLVHLDADAIPTRAVDELMRRSTLPVSPGSCLLAADPHPSFQSNSGVMVCDVAPGMSAGVLSTFYRFGQSLGDSDQDLLSYHFRTATGLALSSRYNTLAIQMVESYRGRSAVLEADPGFVNIVHYTNGGYTLLEKMCSESSKQPAWWKTIERHCKASKQLCPSNEAPFGKQPD